MKKLLISMIVGVLLLTLMVNFVNAEMFLYNSVEKDTINSIVNYHAYYQFDDTSANGDGRDKDIPIVFFTNVQALPFNLTGYNGFVDWCNFTIVQDKHRYQYSFFTGGEIVGFTVNSTIETTSIFYDNSTFGQDYVTINMRSLDSVTASMKCHYTNNQTLYVENALIGTFKTFMPSFECAKCTKYSLEELSNQQAKNEQTTADSVTLWTKIQQVIDWNFRIWLILSYVFKIGFVILGISMIFYAMYWFYQFLQSIAKEI